jgi:hypothetical protein
MKARLSATKQQIASIICRFTRLDLEVAIR